MELYTLIIDFDGDTYIAQAYAESMKMAPMEYISNWDLSDITDEITEQDKISILKQLNEEEFVLLNGIKNVWCGCVALRESLLILNLVHTVSAA